MTSTNANAVHEAVSLFQGLMIDDRLLVLASVYKQIANKLPADAANALPTQDATRLVSRIQQLSKEDQLSALRDLLSAKSSEKDATILDPNPSKALAELVTGGETKTPAHEYGSLSTEAKIAFWYLLAGKLGNNIIGIPDGTKPTQDDTEVIDSLESLNTDELVSFLKTVV
ncbi:hypothetical protein NUACC21_43220 [Scytonema sp. NUACC21]